MPSSRTGLDSKSSCQACLGSRARTFTDFGPFWRSVEDLLRRTVRRALVEQTRGQGRVLGQRLPDAFPRDLRRDLGCLILQPLLHELAGPSTRFEVVAMSEHGLPELLDALLLRAHGCEDGRFPAATLWSQAEHRPQLGHDADMPIEV